MIAFSADGRANMVNDVARALVGVNAEAEGQSIRELLRNTPEACRFGRTLPEDGRASSTRRIHGELPLQASRSESERPSRRLNFRITAVPYAC
ncbi:MAG: hypothetical protein WKF84_08690 [Pyrinomonadaceae bacterium]